MVALGVGALALSNSKDALAITTTPYYINVQDYGAVGNGSTDDTTAIQNALNAAVPSAAPSTGIVVIPATSSFYSIKGSGSAALSVPANVTVYVYGTLKLANGSNRHMFVLNGNNTMAGPGTLDGNKSNQTGGAGCAGFYAASVSNIYINGLTITNQFNWPVNFVACSHVTLEDCVFSNSNSAAQFAGTATLGSSSRCWAIGCSIFGNDDEGFAFYDGVVDSGITGCTIHDCTASGISILSDQSGAAVSQRILIANNHCYYNNVSGVEVIVASPATGLHTDISILGNCLHNNVLVAGARAGVELGSGKRVVCSNNMIFNDGSSATSGGTYGIEVSGLCDRVTINGNDIHDEGQGTGTHFAGVGIYVDAGANHVVIIGNQIYDDQATFTMAYAMGGSATSGVYALSNVVGPAHQTNQVQFGAGNTLVDNQTVTS